MSAVSPIYLRLYPAYRRVATKRLLTQWFLRYSLERLILVTTATQEMAK